MSNPGLSLVLPLHASARQAEYALASLCSAYQEQADIGVEVLVIEVDSDDRLGEARAREHGENVRYLRIEAGPAARSRAQDLGVRESRAPFVGLFRDGAHCVTPRTVSTAVRALRLADSPLVVLPEYRLDAASVQGAGDTEGELAWMEKARFRQRAYDLFSDFRYGPSNPNGFLGPLFGGACLFAPKSAFESLTGWNAANDVAGGAALALFQYMELARRKGTKLIVLVGEGAVRMHYPELDAPNVRAQDTNQQTLLFDAKIPLGEGFHTLHREPVAFGTVAGPVQRFVAESAALAEFHCAMCRSRGDASWYEDEA